MEKKEFWHILRKEKGYQSPPGRFPPLCVIPGFTDFLYYTGIIKVIFTHSRIAAMGNYDRDVWISGSVAMLRIAESVGGRVEISGLEVLEENSGPLVFISNHMSMIDAFFLPAVVLTFKDVTFVVKKTLLDYPFFGKIMRAVQPIAVSRRHPREDLRMVLEKGTQCLSRGRSVIVFPQATRNIVFDPEQFNSLGIKLARKAGVPAVPVALKTDFQGYSKIFKDLGRIDPKKTIRIAFGPPVKVTGKGRENHESVVRFIRDNIIRWGGEVRDISV
ncbi:MAG: lysophospholipid acyltransferase family protein [Desulfococcaceae bacterium]|jgi:1-acyl-sn-glycerol-3-phosphate acyltransferase|nr:lysophospholipid acyltransferase family protein [Desulfococcaceae bacterium]